MVGLPRELPVLALFLVIVACGGSPAPAPSPVPAPVDPAPAPAAAIPTAEASAASPPPSAVPTAAPPPEKPRSSGRPPVIFSDPTEITQTFGSSPPAKVEIGSDKDRMVFRVPENALSSGVNITVKMDPRGKSAGAQVGSIYHLTPFPTEGTKTSTQVQTADAPFELQFTTGGKKGVNLAVGVVETDGQGRTKITWKVLAPKKVDDAAGIASFELTGFGDTLLHLTTKPADKP